MDKTWYLGPLGNLRGLVCPERGMADTSTRYGGVHQSLSGARTMDVTGHRREFEFEFVYLEKSDFEWLQALHTRMVPGPFYLLDPRYRNRLSSQSTSLRNSYDYMSVGLRFELGMARGLTRSFPPDIPYGTHSLAITSFVDGQSVTADAGRMTPVKPEEEITGSWYVRSRVDGETQDVSVSFDLFDADRESQGQTEPVTFQVSNEWTRISSTGIVPGGVSAVVMRLTLGSFTSGVEVAAPMVESGNDVTRWEQGNASAMVLVDQLETSSPMFPLTDCSLVLLEA